MHFSVTPDICYEFENSVKNGKNDDETALLRTIFKSLKPNKRTDKVK